jgi:hypothetical protein
MHRKTAHRSRRSRSLVVLLLALAIVAVFGIAAQQAVALPTFTTAVGGIGPCATCHSKDATHANANHTSIACPSCHLTNPDTPPTPVACAVCHSGVSAILASTTHVATKCGTTAGCHVVASAATITSFAPTSAPVGTIVTLTGTGFTGATAVAFNGTTTSIFVVVSATQITAEVPSGATTGKITVTPASGPVVTSATNFTVTVPAVTTKVTLKVAPTSIRFRRTVKATGAVTPVLALVGSKVALKAQIKKGTRWVTTKSVTATVKASGAYSWTYKPAKRGTYRMQASIKATATKRASHSPWRTFKVR